MGLVAIYGAVLILEGLGVLALSTGLGRAGGITAAVLEHRSEAETGRWADIGTATGFVFGVPLTICAFVLIQRS